MKGYTVREIAEMLGISKGTVNNRIWDGSLKSLKIGVPGVSRRSSSTPT